MLTSHHIDWTEGTKYMSYIKWLTQSQIARFFKEQSKPINLFEWQGQIQWRRWQSVVNQSNQSDLLRFKILSRMFSFSVRFQISGLKLNYYKFAGRKVWAKVPLHLDPHKTPNQHYFIDFLSGQWVIGPKIHPKSNSGWFLAMIWTQMINELRGTIQPLVYFGRVIIRPPQESYSSFLLPSYRIFRSLNLKTLSQQMWIRAFWTRTSAPSKAPEVGSYDRQLITLLMIKYSLKIWRLFHCEKVINAEFHFHRAKFSFPLILSAVTLFQVTIDTIR